MAHLLLWPVSKQKQQLQQQQQTQLPFRAHKQRKRHYPSRLKLKSCAKTWRKQSTCIQMRRQKWRKQTTNTKTASETSTKTAPKSSSATHNSQHTKFSKPHKQSPPQTLVHKIKTKTKKKKSNREISFAIISKRQQQQQQQCFHRQATRWAIIITIIISLVSTSSIRLTSAQPPARMVRLCIASVEPAKLSSQCVMCNRREFPLTVIDCTGITKVNDLIANPLSVQEAACLIYNCRRQVPDIRPEPYHGAISHAARVHGGTGAARYASPSPSSSHFHEMMQAPFSSPSSATSFAASPMMQPMGPMAMMPLPPAATSLATMLGSLPLPFSYATQQPSMASYYAINNLQQQQQPTTYQQASSVPYSMRYGPFSGGSGGGGGVGYSNFAGVPMQFVQQSPTSTAPFGPMAMDASGIIGNGGSAIGRTFGFGSNRNSVASAIWPQSLGGATNVYDTATTQLHPSTMTIASAPSSFMMQPPYSTATMMMSPSTTSTTTATTLTLPTRTKLKPRNKIKPTAPTTTRPTRPIESS